MARNLNTAQSNFVAVFVVHESSSVHIVYFSVFGTAFQNACGSEDEVFVCNHSRPTIIAYFPRMFNQSGSQKILYALFKMRKSNEAPSTSFIVTS